VGPFYPSGTPRSDWLPFYARVFPSVEVDSTFHTVPSEPVVASWATSVPGGFVFSLKVPQEITHERRLVDCEQALERFCRRAALLGPALGPLVLQLSPGFRPSLATRAALGDFLTGLPSGFQWAIEFRHGDWLSHGTLEALGAYNVALVLADSRWIRRGVMLDLALEPTADFGYVRWVGPNGCFTDYSRVQVERDREIGLWAMALEKLARRVRIVFGYFNNHYQGHAPHSVRTLARHFATEAPDDAASADQHS
jgi:uncharacterized protein YecE (DUF72 family)